MKILDYTDHLNNIVQDLLTVAYNDVDCAVDDALKRKGVYGTDCWDRISIQCTDSSTVYMLDNKPIVTVSKPQLEVVGTSYRVYFKIEQHGIVQLEVGKYYVAVNGSVIKITAKVSGDVYYGAGMYFNKHGKAGKGVGRSYSLIKEWKE
jgi:hypothetical protein